MRRLPFVCAFLGAALLLTSAPSVADDPPSEFGTISGSFGSGGEDVPAGAMGAERVDDPDGPTAVGLMGIRNFSFRVAPGQYRIWFTPPPGDNDTTWAYYPGVHTRAEAAIVTVRAGEVVSGLVLDLERNAGSIAGTVSFEDGATLQDSPSSMVPYYLDGDDGWLPVPGGYQGGVDPSYTYDGLPPGTYRLRYEARAVHNDTASGFVGGTDEPGPATPVEVRSSETTRVDMTPRRSATLTGRVVTAAGRPVPGTLVVPMRRLGGWWYRGDAVRTNALGRYRIPRLGAAEHVLQLRPPAPYDEVFSGDAVRDATQLDAHTEAPEGAVAVRTVAATTSDAGDQVVQRQGVLRGIVVDHDQGRPVAGVTVIAHHVLGADQDLFPWGTPYVVYGQTLTATTNADGRFSFGQVPRGPYRLRLDDPWNDGFLTEHEGEALNDELFPSVRSIAFVESGATTVADPTVTGYMPTLSDTTPVVGQKLSAVPPSHVDGSPPAGSTWVWRRDGVVIDGATSSTYRPVPADRGTRLTAQVVLPTDDKPLVHTTPPSVKVAVGRPVLTVTGGSPSAGRITLTVRGTAPDVPTSLLDGTVEVVHVSSGRRTTGSMVDGSLTVSLTGQPKGIQTYSARFLAQPDRFAASALAQRSVTVR